MNRKLDILELANNLDDSIIYAFKSINDAFRNTHYQDKVYLYGGAVRDILLGRCPNDLNFVIDGTHNFGLAAKKVAKHIGCDRRGENPIYSDDRESVYLEIPGVSYPISFENSKAFLASSVRPDVSTDWRCRDFTVNALYYNISTNRLFDPSGKGLSDLHNLVIRSTKETTDLTLLESPMRIIRALRMTAYGFSIEKNLWFSILKRSSLIGKLKKTDIKTEMSMLMVGTKPSEALRRMESSGVLKSIFEDVYELKSLYYDKNQKKTILAHTYEMVDYVFAIPENRFAALFHEVGANIVELPSQVDEVSAHTAHIELKNFGFEEDFIDAVSGGILGHGAFRNLTPNGVPTKKSLKKFVTRFANSYAIALDLMNAENNLGNTKKKNQVSKIASAIEKMLDEDELENETKVRPKLPLTGDDLMEHFDLPKGPHIGHLLKALDVYLQEHPEATKDELLIKAALLMEKSVRI